MVPSKTDTARGTQVAGIDLAETTAMVLDEIVAWALGVTGTLPTEMHPMARMIIAQLLEMARRLVQLGGTVLPHAPVEVVGQKLGGPRARRAALSGAYSAREQAKPEATPVEALSSGYPRPSWVPPCSRRRVA